LKTEAWGARNFIVADPDGNLDLVLGRRVSREFRLNLTPRPADPRSFQLERHRPSNVRHHVDDKRYEKANIGPLYGSRRAGGRSRGAAFGGLRRAADLAIRTSPLAAFAHYR
jgi:hypothetical protein